MESNLYYNTEFNRNVVVVSLLRLYPIPACIISYVSLTLGKFQPDASYDGCSLKIRCISISHEVSNCTNYCRYLFHHFLTFSFSEECRRKRNL